MMSDDSVLYIRDITHREGYADYDHPRMNAFLWKVSVYPSDDRAGAIAAIHSNCVQYRAPKRLDLATLLTERQLQGHGLHLAGGEGAQRWLVPIDLHDVEHPKPQPRWLGDLRVRMEDLKKIADEEELAFNEKSAQQALNFVVKLRDCRLPSAFLIGNGNVRLLWANSAGEQVGLQFLVDEEVQFVMMVRRENKLGSTMGSDRADAVMRFITAAGLDHLLSQ